MKSTYEPLRQNWKVDEDRGFVQEQIQQRVDTESWYTHCKGYPNIKSEDIIKVKTNDKRFKR